MINIVIFTMLYSKKKEKSMKVNRAYKLNKEKQPSEENGNCFYDEKKLV